ncbi:alpha/beta hydrolase [Aspergillus puulaauensis]|uniref:AB hydrolase-1 domain-containing protein n=1 Tax=Aspergillus puulaauensis TaxID=1220207 RepID=A0A7R8AFW0_9EURO|nr:uncharacterized protein APUU_10179A [Aspergillus puulaauensis]BCS17351.1 hypothetical protein APUU_10179A [Aspergillus puulaauensis]
MSDPITLICDNRFHRRITLDTPNGPLSVSFADIGCPTGPALLYLPGMFASRYLGVPMHVMAERAGVRMIVVDRPGMGGSTDVPLARRFDVWVDLVPRLLAHLEIQRVSLASHSAGTMYLFNTWLKCRDFVNPVIFLLAPWVDLVHSRVTSLQIAKYLPNKAFDYWHLIPRFFVKQASPVLASSGAVMRRMSMSSGIGTSRAEEDHTFLDENFRRIERDYGVPKKESEELSRLAVQFMFTESTVGANSEALQCLRKGDGGEWGICGDYVICRDTLAALERQRDDNDRATVRTYFSETDALVGGRGQKYFQECWAPGVEGIDFECKVIKGTDHDTVAQSVGVWEEIFSMVH